MSLLVSQHLAQLIGGNSMNTLGEGRKKAGSGSHSQSSGTQVTKVNLPSQSRTTGHETYLY